MSTTTARASKILKFLSHIPLLTSARVVTRYYLPEGELPHVTCLLDALLNDFSSKWTLVQSYKKTSSLRFIQYVAAWHPAAEMDPFYCRWVFNATTKLVASRGDLAALQWLAESYLPDASMTAAMEVAAANGYLHILEWLFDQHRDRVDWGCVAMCGAFENDHAEVVGWLRMHTVPRAECVHMVLRSAAKAGNLAVVQWLCEEYDADTGDAFVHAQKSREWATARWLLANCELPSDRTIWSAAAADGALAYMQFAHSCFPQEMPHGRPSPPVVAAANGHLDVLQWLHSELGVKLKGTVVNQAAMNGHLEVVQWLHAKGCVRCTNSTMDHAGQNGHFEIVRWLHDNCNKSCSEMAMTSAAGNGHLETVQWLHTNRTEGCTTWRFGCSAKSYGCRAVAA